MDTPGALIADLAKTIGLPEIPLDENAGWHLNLGSDDAYLYCRDGKNLLIVVPVTQLPADIACAQTNSLLRENLFDSSFSPFQIATDAGGMIIQWGLLPIADLNGPAIVDILENLAAAPKCCARCSSPLSRDHSGAARFQRHNEKTAGRKVCRLTRNLVAGTRPERRFIHVAWEIERNMTG